VPFGYATPGTLTVPPPGKAAESEGVDGIGGPESLETAIPAEATPATIAVTTTASEVARVSFVDRIRIACTSVIAVIRH
jgi:D-tyrosyl-tRNA(Tyr) deacylase